jgi:hypothetical protein
MDYSAEDTITISTDSSSSIMTLGEPEYTINISSEASANGIQSSNMAPTISFDYEARKNILDFTEVEEMCEEYPGLKKVYEKFRHVYDLVKQDWIGKQNEIT